MIPGHLIIDTTNLTPEHTTALHTLATANNGWPHPDGTRWIIPTPNPATHRDLLLRDGFPPTAIRIAQ